MPQSVKKDALPTVSACGKIHVWLRLFAQFTVPQNGFEKSRQLPGVRVG
jgi:hypothetical protein